MIDYRHIRNYLDEKRLDYPLSMSRITSYSKTAQKNYEFLSLEILRHNFDNEVSTFIPGQHFVSLSVTGSNCELNCEHCHSQYLSHMYDVSSEDKLRKTLSTLVDQGVQGCLISGGCDREGKVPLLKYHSILKEFKKKSSLIFNFHVGLLNLSEIRKLRQIQPDFVSFDFTLDEAIIQNVYHLDKQVDDYIATFKTLIGYGIRTIPHICVGLNYGNLKKEYEALKWLLKYSYPMDLIVFLVIIPPPDPTEFHHANVDEIGTLFTTARLLFPKTELSLGCMRPRGPHRHRIEELAIRSGFNRLEIPSKKTLNLIKEFDIKTKTYNVCCAVSKNQLDKLSIP